MQAWRHRGTQIPKASGMQDMAEVAGLLDAAANWPSSSFQHGRNEARVRRFRGLRKMLKRGRRASMSGMAELGVNMGMRTHRLDPHLVEGHATHDSASESSGASDGSDSDDTFSPRRSAEASRDISANVSLAPSDNEETSEDNMAASENDISIDEEERPATPIRRAFSSTANATPRPMERSRFGPSRTPTTDLAPGQKPRKVFSLELPAESSHSDTELTNEESSPEENRTVPQRPTPVRQQSAPKFTSKPVPETKVAKDPEGPGPSIMFADHPSPNERRGSSAYQRHQSAPQQPPQPFGDPNSRRASQQTALSASAVPLSFNDLPCRAQHLILNELMRAVSASSTTSSSVSPAQSPDERAGAPPPLPDMSRYASMLAAALGGGAADGGDDDDDDDSGKGKANGTAAVFTTLPSPVSGTCESEKESLRYLLDLEVLCKDLPPVLLVHSNSISVTMSL
ncbi:MAG: hypothetical protein INR71_04330 [Terriglobus roseus]|nr:hypothetical protein [Terriglobus roseus]